MDYALEELYFTWLHNQVHSARAKHISRTYKSLLDQLHEKEFVWTVENDCNRAEEGQALRYEFLEDLLNDDDPIEEEFLTRPCSMLELLLVLARRLAFESEGKPKDWFWHLLETMEISEYTDLYYDRDAHDEINSALNRVIGRRYEPNGDGGLFPLEEPKEDQRKIELWYQLSAYVIEKFY